MERLRTLRKNMQLYQKDVASHLGIDRTTYVKYETGASQPDGATLAKLADYFGVTVDYLLGREEQKEKPAAPKSDGLWDAICANETKLKLANQIARMDDDSLRRLIAIMEAALLTPPE